MKILTNRPPPQAPLLSRYIFLTRYIHFGKPEFEPPTLSLACTFLTSTLHSHLEQPQCALKAVHMD